MKAILNITLNGRSADTQVMIDFHIGDHDVKRVAVELIRSGDVPGLHIRDLPATTFDFYVVDRFDGRDGMRRIYLRPKVPFGASMI
jgi:hypothetical protein